MLFSSGGFWGFLFLFFPLVLWMGLRVLHILSNWSTIELLPSPYGSCFEIRNLCISRYGCKEKETPHWGGPTGVLFVYKGTDEDHGHRRITDQQRLPAPEFLQHVCHGSTKDWTKLIRKRLSVQSQPRGQARTWVCPGSAVRSLGWRQDRKERGRG